MFKYLVKLPIVMFNTQKDIAGDGGERIDPESYHVSPGYINLTEVDQISPAPAVMDIDGTIHQMSTEIFSLTDSLTLVKSFVKLPLEELAEIVNKYQLELDQYQKSLAVGCCQKNK